MRLNNINYVKIISLTIILSLVLSGITPAFVNSTNIHRSPTINPLIIYMDNSFEVRETISELKQDFPASHAFLFDSYLLQTIIPHTSSPIIWVGHGSEQGVLLHSKPLPWQYMAKLVNLSPSKDILLMCNSANIYKYSKLTPSDVLTFPGEIDGVLGALLIAYAFTASFSIFQNLIDRVLDIIHSVKKAYFLYFGSHEKAWWIINFIVILNLWLLNLYLDPKWTLVQKAGARILAIGHVTIFTTFIYLAKGWITPARAASAIGAFLQGSLGIMVTLYNAAGFWEKAAMIAAMGLSIISLIIELAGDSITGGLVTAGKVAAIAASIITLAVTFYHDYTDPNDTVG